MSLPQTDYFDANLPGASQTVRIASLYDAKVFVCRWVIRDRDPTARIGYLTLHPPGAEEAALIDGLNNLGWTAWRVPSSHPSL